MSEVLYAIDLHSVGWTPGNLCQPPRGEGRISIEKREHPCFCSCRAFGLGLLHLGGHLGGGFSPFDGRCLREVQHLKVLNVDGSAGEPFDGSLGTGCVTHVRSLTLIKFDARLATIWEQDHGLATRVGPDSGTGLARCVVDEVTVAVQIYVECLSHQDLDASLSDRLFT